MPLVSAAQNQEDIMLWRALRHVRGGFYIDVGAADPVNLSVTRIFYEQGWHGINLEPNRSHFAALSKMRPRDINLPLGAGREAGRQIFYDVEDSGLSTFDTAIATHHRADGWTVTEETVETLPLADICRRYRPEGPIHFLKIDVEGSEGDVLAGADFGAFRPWIVLVEATLPLSQVQSYAEWEPRLTGQGYTFVWFDGLNRFYVAVEMKSLLEEHFRVPPNIFDDFVPASALLQRAEQAEQSLHRAKDEAAKTAHDTAVAMQQTVTELTHQCSLTAEMTQQTVTELAHQCSLTAEAQRRASDLGEQLAEARAQQTVLSKKLDETSFSLAAANRRSQANLATLVETGRRAQLAEAQVSWLLASTSWRVTAPLRLARRLLPRGQIEQASPRSPATGPIGKDLARQVFHRGMQRLLQMPGGRRSSRLVRSIAPGPVEWLTLRYRAYERQAAGWLPTSPVTVDEQDTVVAAGQMAFVNLSEEEARLYSQFATRGLATDAGMARA